MKKIILSALLASTVAVTAFAAPSGGKMAGAEMQGGFVGAVMMLVNASGGDSIMLTLSPTPGAGATEGGFKDVLQANAGTDTDVTALPNQGKVAMFKVKTLKNKVALICAPVLAAQGNGARDDRPLTVCGINPRNVQALVAALQTNAPAIKSAYETKQAG